MEFGRLIEMGQITTIDSDGTRHEYPMALVIEFASVAEIKQAIEDGRCNFSFGAEDDSDDPQSDCHDCGEDTCVCAP